MQIEFPQKLELPNAEGETLDIFLPTLQEPNGNAEDVEDAEDAAFFTSCVAMLGSFALHLVVLLISVLWVWNNPPVPVGDMGLVASMEPLSEEEMFDAQEEDSIEIETSTEDTESELPIETEEIALDTPSIVIPTLLPEELETTTETEDNPDGDEPLTEVDNEVMHAGEAAASARVAAVLPDAAGYDGRGDEATHQRLLQGGGGTPGSEDAVLRGLRWLYAHQQADRENKKTWGCWTFDMAKAPYCNCTHRGENASSTGATALAMLAMLGHGSTREKGEFQKSIQQGLYYLSTRAIRRRGIPGLDLREGSMYSQAMATLAICEAHAMEGCKDEGLEALARGAVQWILWAQDPNSGGWRYQPREAGDVTVTTWMIMVLKSAKMAGIEIPSTTLVGVERFLNSVASEENTRYSYQVGKKPIQSTTAIGLFARMFTGAKQDDPFMQRGADLLSDWGYSGTDLYYNYYATLFLRHYGTHRWERWNPVMRDYLIATQSLKGHEYGSWYFDEPEKTNNQTGGRLYTTAMATMILEVYYRYMPIYQEKVTE